MSSPPTARPVVSASPPPQLGGPFPPNVLFRILQALPTAALFTAGLVHPCWRALIYASGPRSQALLKPHLAVLRERFGTAAVPSRLPIAEVRVLVARYARSELLAEFAAVEGYNLPRGRAAAVSDDANLLAVTTGRRVVVYSLRRRAWASLVSLKLPACPVALALGDAYLAVADGAGKVHLYNLLAKTGATGLVYTVDAGGRVTALAVSQDASEGPPLVAVVLEAEVRLIHPSLALAQKREAFFTGGIGVANKKKYRLRKHSASAKFVLATTSRTESTLSAKSLGKQPAISSSAPLSIASPAGQKTWVLTAPLPPFLSGLPARLAFSMSGRQLLLDTHYLGSAWSAECAAEVSRRSIYALKPGQDLAAKPATPTALWRHYRGVAGSLPRWWPKPLDSAASALSRPLHAWDSFYIARDAPDDYGGAGTPEPNTKPTTAASRGRGAGESGGGWVRIISVAPFESRFLLYRDGGPYAVYEGGCAEGYVAFIPPQPGTLAILPFARIPWETSTAVDVASRAVLLDISDEAGGAPVVALIAGRERVVVLLRQRVLVVSLWTGAVVEGERCRDRDRDREVKGEKGGKGSRGGGVGGGGGGGGGGGREMKASNEVDVLVEGIRKKRGCTVM